MWSDWSAWYFTHDTVDYGFVVAHVLRHVRPLGVHVAREQTLVGRVP